jgi:hypothetical protein
MKNIALRCRLLFAFLPVSILVACGGGDGGASPPVASPQAAVAVQTPAACNYAHVWVTVTSASVLRDDSGTEVAQDITFIAPKRIDLINSPQGLLQAMGATPLLAGHYTQLRLVLAADENTVQNADGTQAALDVPGGTTTGLKLNGDITVQSGSAADAALAGFDPCAAIVLTGNGTYMLQPQSPITIRAIPVAGPEVPGTPGAVVPVPGGGDHGQRQWRLDAAALRRCGPSRGRARDGYRRRNRSSGRSSRWRAAAGPPCGSSTRQRPAWSRCIRGHGMRKVNP